MSQFTSLNVVPQRWGHTITIHGGYPEFLTHPIGFPAQSWQTEVWNTLSKIEGSETGALFMRLINNPAELGGHCKIVPIDVGSPHRTSALPASWEKALPSGKDFQCSSEQACNGTRPNGAPDRVVTNGRGSDVYVRYNPSSWSGPDLRLGLDNDEDKYQADDVLLHELVHAYQVMRGAFSLAHAPKDTAMHYDEEFYAITLTNIYVSESGRTDALRADHRAEHTTLTPWQAYEPHFVSENKELVEKMCRAFPESFIFALSNLTKPEFNPFRYRREELENRYKPKTSIFSY